MHLYLVQHGEAAPETVDPARPLTPNGRKDIETLSAFLSECGVDAQRVINSGKLRARDSAEILAGAIAPKVVIDE